MRHRCSRILGVRRLRPHSSHPSTRKTKTRACWGPASSFVLAQNDRVKMHGQDNGNLVLPSPDGDCSGIHQHLKRFSNWPTRSYRSGELELAIAIYGVN